MQVNDGELRYEEILVVYFWHSANLLHEKSFRESRLFSVFFCSSWHSINLRTSLCSLYITFPSFLHSITFYKKRLLSSGNRACFLQADIYESKIKFYLFKPKYDMRLFVDSRVDLENHFRFTIIHTKHGIFWLRNYWFLS